MSNNASTETPAAGNDGQTLFYNFSADKYLHKTPALARGLLGVANPPFIDAYDKGGISNNSSADQSTALAALYASVPSGSIVYFGATVQPIIGLHAPGKTIWIMCAGRDQVEFRPPASPGTNAKIFDFSTYPNCRLTGAYVNGNNNVNVAEGVSMGGFGYVDWCRVANCTQGANSAAGGHLNPHGYGAAGIMLYPGGIAINNIVTDCVYPIYVYYPQDGRTKILFNDISATTRTNTNQGIILYIWSGETSANQWSGALVQGNNVFNVGYDPPGAGQEGNGIQIQNCRGVRVLNNIVRDCQSAGIHPASGSYECVVEGNDVSYCGINTAGGITFETQIGVSTALPTGGSPAGGSCINNVVYNCSKYGIMPSYSPGTVVSGNQVHDNGWEGIWCDSDRVTIVDNIVYNNVSLNAAPVPPSSPNVKAQIKVTTGTLNTITGNQVFNTLTASHADYAIAVNGGSSHIIKDNQLHLGWKTAAIYQQGAQGTNIVADNQNGSAAP